MIFALVGTSHLPFDRFIVAVENIAQSTGQKTIIQYGHSNLKSDICDGFDFCSNEKIIQLMNEADVIICQGGFGSMFDAIKSGKRVIAIPRLVESGETAAEQLSLVNHYVNLGLVEVCTNTSDIVELFNNNNTIQQHKIELQAPYVKDILEEYLTGFVD